jgi:hypothetical protein
MKIDVPTIDVSFLLTLQKKYNSILTHLRDIVDIYDEIIGNPELLLTLHSDVLLKIDLSTRTDSVQIVEQKKHYLSKIKHITQTITNVTKDIHQNCVHEFVNDSIDIDCECSQNITYCTICEYTKQ